MELTAQTYLITQIAEAFYRSHLFVKVHDDLELIETQYLPAFVDKDLYLSSVRKKWFKPGTTELTVSNRKVFNLEFVKDVFGHHKVLVLDIGANKSSLVTYQDGVFSIKEEDMGLGEGLFKILTDSSMMDAIYHRLPIKLERRLVYDYLAEKQEHPARLPSTPDERIIELSAAGVIMSHFAKEYSRQFSTDSMAKLKGKSSPLLKSSPVNVAILTGEVFWGADEHKKGFNANGMSLLSLIDGAGLEGIWRIYIDTQGNVPSLGRLKKEGVVGLATDRFLRQLGTVIVLSHQENDGKSLGRLTFDLGYNYPQELHVEAGQIFRLPFEKGAVGGVELALHQSVSITGLDEGSSQPEIVGGDLGIVIDARGRPLKLRGVREEILSNWLEGVGVSI